MSRNYDWTPLGSDPVPGDPDAVLAGGRDYVGVADAISAAERKLRRIDLGSYVSEAVDELDDTARKVADNIRKAHDRYRETGEALIQYAPHLERAQTDSVAALHSAASAQQASDTAATDATRYRHLADTATDPADRARYTTLADDDHDSHVAASALSAARARVDDIRTDLDRAAEHAIHRIKQIIDHDGLKDGWWDNWGADLLSVITDIAGWVSTIAGVLALCVCWIPVIGQVLASALLVISAVAAIVNAVGNIILAATGERSWTEAIISIVGAVLSCVGLGGAAKVLGAGRAAARITTKAAAQEGFDAATNTFTVRAALKLHPLDLAESERLWNQPVQSLGTGDRVFRLYGDKALDTGASYSTIAPTEFRNARSSLGLPDVNSAERALTGEVTDLGNLKVTRHALPLDGTPGGAPEYILPGPFGPSKGVDVLSDVPFSVR